MKQNCTKQRKTVFWFLLFAFQIVISTGVHSQVLIGEPANGIMPQDYSVLELLSNGKRGLRLPQLTTDERDAMTAQPSFSSTVMNQARGLTIFNTTTNCMETWNGGGWLALCASGVIATIDCTQITAAVAGRITQGVPVNINATLLYTGMSGTGVSVGSTAILLWDGQVLGSANGLSIVVDGGQTIAGPSGSVNVRITGTTSQTTDFSIPISLGGGNCTVNITMTRIATCTPLSEVTASSSSSSGAVGETVTLTAAPVPTSASTPITYQWQKSIDRGATWSDVSGATSSTYAATIAVGSNLYRVRASNDCTTTPVSSDGIDITLLCTQPTGVTVTPPLTATEGQPFALTAAITGGIAPYSYIWQRSTDGSTWTDISASSGTTSTTTVTFNTQEATMGTYYYRIKVWSDGCEQTDANAFISNSVSVRIEMDCTVNSTLPGGKLTFMCYNLGANSDMTIDQQRAYASRNNTDAGVYGDLYQWGRPTDGHEKRTSSVARGPVSFDAKGSSFVINSNAPIDWVSPQNPNLWGSTKTANDPCPDGWRVPTRAEWNSILDTDTNTIQEITSGATRGYLVTPVGSSSPKLFLPAAGWRGYGDGVLSGSTGTYGYYWSSTTSGTDSYFITLSSGAVTGSAALIADARAYGRSVRCVKQ